MTIKKASADKDNLEKIIEDTPQYLSYCDKFQDGYIHFLNTELWVRCIHDDKKLKENWYQFKIRNIKLNGEIGEYNNHYVYPMTQEFGIKYLSDLLNEGYVKEDILKYLSELIVEDETRKIKASILNIIQISKKPIIIKALYFDGKNVDEVKIFCKDNFDEKKMQIKTLEGLNELRKGAYIIEGVKKENYCINEATLDKSYTIEKKDGNIFILKTKSNKFNAVKFDGSNREDIFKWMKTEDKDKKFIVKASWGNLEVSKGDYIVNGINGDYYPIKPDIFKKTYDVL